MKYKSFRRHDTSASRLRKAPPDVPQLDETHNAEEPKTLEAIGREVGVTRERVRQIESAVLAKLKASGQAGRLQGTTE